MSLLKFPLLLGCLVALPAGADTLSDTTITVKKGVPETQCLAFEIVSGNEEISGDPEFDRGKARASWKAACAEWKKEMRELHPDNQILTLNCNTAKPAKENDQHSFSSSGTYKIKVRVREKL